jgi:hypothetical protein
MDDQNQSDELYPIAVLIDELKVNIPPPPHGAAKHQPCELRIRC